MNKKRTPSPGDKDYIDWVNKWGKKKKTNKVPDYVPQEEKPEEKVNPIEGTMRVIIFIALIILAVVIFNKKDPVGKVKGFFDDRSDKKVECAERAEDASNSYAAKKIYKACMSN